MMLVILWWKLSSHESYLMMKVVIVKEVMTCDVSPVAMFLFPVCKRLLSASLAKSLGKSPPSTWQSLSSTVWIDGVIDGSILQAACFKPLLGPHGFGWVVGCFDIKVTADNGGTILLCHQLPLLLWVKVSLCFFNLLLEPNVKWQMLMKPPCCFD